MEDRRNRRIQAAGTLAAACLALPLLLAGCTDRHASGPGASPGAAGTGSDNPPPAAANLAAPQPPAEGRLVSSGPGQAASPPVTAYYVLLDDGGSHGVRFGCNDSLVALARTGPAAGDALASSVAALLASPQLPQGAGPELPSGLHNALAASRLTFLSGSFDGTTVTVYLAGTLRPAGACDAQRIEAQLTQTAVAAVGAIRADIHVNGQSLAEALHLDPVSSR